MPTRKPRVTVSLDPDDYALLRDLSELNGESISSQIAGLVSAAQPVLSRLLAFARDYRDASEQRRENVLELLSTASARVEPDARALADQMLDLLGPEASDPRPVITGVYTPNPLPSPDESPEG